MSVLGKSKATDTLARHKPWQPTCVLLRRTERMDGLNRERALHRRKRAQAGVGTLQFLHDEAVGRVAQSGTAMLVKIWRVKTQCAHPRNKMFRKFRGAMGGNDLGQNFLLHEPPCPVARGALLMHQKLFDVVVVERTHIVRHDRMRASLAVAPAELNGDAAVENPSVFT